ncbi:MAG: group II intron reverse transcriptase domain-containing protein, partial [Anaerolineae bacterium]|nr:group II intron reverse transcriptase domain-containing protein [Anaerolineae bacterium]
VLWHEAHGRRWVLDGDIEACFDCIPHARLLAQMADLGDERITRLVAQWCEAGSPTRGYGVAQGAVISPLLANIYLHQFDRAMSQAGAALVRYADDFVVMCVDLDEALWALRQAAGALAELELRLNEDKTVILPFGLDFTFLGARFDG